RSGLAAMSVLLCSQQRRKRFAKAAVQLLHETRRIVDCRLLDEDLQRSREALHLRQLREVRDALDQLADLRGVRARRLRDRFLERGEQLGDLAERAAGDLARIDVAPRL